MPVSPDVKFFTFHLNAASCKPSDANLCKPRSHEVIYSPFGCPGPVFPDISGFMWFLGDGTECNTRGSPDLTCGFSPDFLNLRGRRLSLASILVPKTQWCCFPRNLALRNRKIRSSCHGSVVINTTRIHEVLGSIPGLVQWVKDLALPWAVV